MSTPLHDSWSVWWDPRHSRVGEPMDPKSYEQRLVAVHNFSTVEEFWQGWSWLRLPTECPTDCNLSVFRRGHKPMWETFPDGGMWIMRIRRSLNLMVDGSRNRRQQQTAPVAMADALWENLVLCCIGETFQMPEVVGAVVSTRSKEVVISVWNVANDNPAVRFRVGQKLREFCCLPPNFLVRYKFFETAMIEGNSYRHAQPFIFPESPTALQLAPKSTEVAADEGSCLTVAVAE